MISIVTVRTMYGHDVTTVSNRRSRLASSVAAAACGLLLLGASCSAQTASEQQTTAAQTEISTPAAIRPFRVNVADEALVDLRRRIAATRWPDRETVADRSQGAPLAKLQELARYWGTDYDWRKAEAKLNALPQFVTTIDGVIEEVKTNSVVVKIAENVKVKYGKAYIAALRGEADED